MRDINTELRQSYFSLLAGNILINSSAIPIYYSQVPITPGPSTSPDNYILINTLFNSGFNDDTYNYTNTSLQLMIVTKGFSNNSGAIADDIAGQIFCILIPNPNIQPVQIVSGWVMGTTLQNDVVQGGLNDGQKKVVNRVLTFGHKIRHYSCAIDSGIIYYGTQENDDDPTDFTNSITQNCELPISIDYGPEALPRFFWLAVPADCPIKDYWEDLNNVRNAGMIGANTDLYEVREMDIGGDPYTLYMTNYLTGFNGFSNQVKYF